MAAIKETIIAGGTIWERKIYTRTRKAGEKRDERRQPTIESVEKHNQRNAERGLQIKLHHNFAPGDHFLTLTYEGKAPTVDEAKKAIKKFIDSTRRLCKKTGQEFKWLLVTEYENKRVHHHMVMNNVMTIQDINALWNNGTVRDTILDESRDWRKLGEYLLKETSKTFRNPDSPSRLRYTCSRNLTMPPVYREEISPVDVYEEPEAIKGYYVDPESVYQGENPFTGRPYVEYVMLPIDKPRTRFNKRQKTKYKTETHWKWIQLHADRQLEIDL